MQEPPCIASKELYMQGCVCELHRDWLPLWVPVYVPSM